MGEPVRETGRAPRLRERLRIRPLVGTAPGGFRQLARHRHEAAESQGKPARAEP